MADMWKWNVARHGCPLSVAPSETWERLPRDPIQPKSKSVEYTAAGISILEGFLRLPTAEQEAMGWLCQDLQQAPAAFGTVHSYFYRLHRSSSWVVKQPDEPGIVSTAKPKMALARTIAPDGAPVVVEATGGAMLKLTQQGGGSVHHYTFDGSTMVKGPDFVKVHARTVHADIACSPPSRAHTPRAPRAPAHAHDRLQAPPTHVRSMRAHACAHARKPQAGVCSACPPVALNVALRCVTQRVCACVCMRVQTGAIVHVVNTIVDKSDAKRFVGKYFRRAIVRKVTDMPYLKVAELKPQHVGTRLQL